VVLFSPKDKRRTKVSVMPLAPVADAIAAD